MKPESTDNTKPYYELEFFSATHRGYITMEFPSFDAAQGFAVGIHLETSEYQITEVEDNW